MLDDVIKFCKEIIRSYLEDRNIPKVIKTLDKNISWVGLNDENICYSFFDVCNLIEKQMETLASGLVIGKEEYRGRQIDSDTFIVIGLIEIGRIRNSNEPVKKIKTTLLVKKTEDRYVVAHVHFSNFSRDNYEDELKPNEKYKLLLDDKNAAIVRLNSQIDALIGGIDGGVILCDAENKFKILQHNDGFKVIMGCPMQNVSFVNKDFADYIYDSDIPDITEKITKTLANMGVFTGEYRLRRPDGGIVWVRDKSTVLTGFKNKSILLSVLTEVTEKRKERQLLNRTLEEVKLSNEKNKILIKRAGLVTFDYDIVLNRLTFGAEMRARCSLPTTLDNAVESVIAFGLIDRSSVEEFRNAFLMLQKGRTGASAAVKMAYADGRMVPVEITLTTIFNDNGDPVRAVGFITDKNFEEFAREKNRQYYEMLSVNPIINFVADIDLDKLITFSHDWLKQAGKKVEFKFSLMIENLCNERLHPADRQKVAEAFDLDNLSNSYADGKNRIQIEYRRIAENRENIWVLATIDLVRDKLTSRLLAYVNAKDINEEKLRELKMAEEHKYYLAMLNKAATIYEVNYSDDKIIGGNEFWEEKFGIKAELSYSESMIRFADIAVHPKDAQRFRDAFLLENVLAAYHSGKNEITCEYRRLSGKDGYDWILCSAHFMEGGIGDSIRGFSYAQVITNKKELENTLMRKAQHDVLTNLLNKAYCNEQIINCLSKKTAIKRMHAFIVIDVDDFKKINDTYGHLEGDEVLVKVGEILSGIFRKSDILGRIGGDEFVVFMKEIAEKEIAVKKSTEILTELGRIALDGVKANSVSASIGIAYFNGDGQTFNELYAHADKAMYCSKNNGKNRITLYENMK